MRLDSRGIRPKRRAKLGGCSDNSKTEMTVPLARVGAEKMLRSSQTPNIVCV